MDELVWFRYRADAAEDGTWIIRDLMSGGYVRDAAGQIMHHSPEQAAYDVEAALNAQHEQRMTDVFGPERGERVSFA